MTPASMNNALLRIGNWFARYGSLARRFSRIAFVAASVFPTILPLKAVAEDQLPKEWLQCIGRESSNADVVIEGCTEVIATSGVPSRILAIAFNNRGVAYRLKREYDRALSDYDQAIKLNPNYPNAHNNRGIIFRIKGDYDRAIKDYDDAIRLNSDYPAAFYNRALAYSDKGDYQRALADFEIVLRFDRNNALALYGRGVVRMKYGEREAGEADIVAAKMINPDIASQFDRSGF